jgi:hypothetical protein
MDEVYDLLALDNEAKLVVREDSVLVDLGRKLRSPFWRIR